MRPFSPAPAARYEPYLWDAIDHLIFRPVSELWTFTPKRESINVNALDEVPSSSWFENRISRHAMTPEEVARGACESIEFDVPAPWRIIAAKSEGLTPGFVFEDAAGIRYVLKVDRAQQREQATAADAIVAAIYHAAGYHVPCNRVVGFTEEMLVLDPRVSGVEREDLQEVIDIARRLPDGRYRALVSRFVEGQPIGPWSYLGTEPADPNDVVPHESRRELRGMFLLNAWVNHWDARDTDTLATWIGDANGVGYVRHYLIDFGECLGLYEGNERRLRRFGHTQWFDAQHVVEDALTLGLLPRPWQVGEIGPGGEALGYFDDHGFAPDQWRPDYWNGAFERHTERDAAWMARIIARFSRAHLEAVARLGRYSNPTTESELVRILAGRRRAILERYLTRLSPLTDPRLDGETLCLTDLALRSRIRWPEERRYTARAWSEEGSLGVPATSMKQDEVCVALSPFVEHDYVVIELGASTVGRETTGPLHVHLARTSEGPFVVGLERH